MKYTVRQGETIYDVCMNANGSLYSLDENLDLNGFDTYTPTLEPGQELIVSDVVRNNAAVEVLQQHPLNGESIPPADLELQLTYIDVALHPEQYVYGIEWSSENSSPACTRIGWMPLHVSLPIQSKMRRCVLRDNGTVAYYLDPNDSTKKADGTPANLDGTDGQVMVEIPAHYRKFETDGTTYRCLLSEYALPGFHFVPLVYRSAYEAAVDRTDPSAPKLASVVNTTTAFRGGDNTADWDGTYRTLLGRPASNISLANFRSYARNRGVAGMNGAGWNCDVYEIQKTCYWLYVVEYAKFNCQLDYNPAPTIDGYKQGGLSLGVTTLNSSKWTSFNGQNPFIPCGTTNVLGNNTGVVAFTMPEEYDTGTTTTVMVSSYRGIENLFGHIWSIMDGCKSNVQSDQSGGLSQFFVCTDPSKFQSNDYDGYDNRGNLSRNEGFIKMMVIGEYGENMPSDVGGTFTTYFCDYFYTNIPNSGESQRALLFYGASHTGYNAGLSCSASHVGITYLYTNLGSRLCFIP